MRTRIITIVTVVLATAAVGVVGALALFAGTGEPLPAALTTLPSTTTTTTTTLPQAASTTAATTTTTTTPAVPSRLTVIIEKGDPGSGPAVLAGALYAWMVDPAAPAPEMPPALQDHLAVGRVDENRTMAMSIHSAELADGTGVAVVLAGEDVVLTVEEAGGWQIVGARLTGFGLGPWYGDPVRHVFVIGTDARPHESQPDLRADSIHIVAASLTERGGGIVGFPRDSYVAASYGSDKFSSVNVRASTAEMVRIAEDLSGLELDGYILTGFAGFKKLVNGLGGVEVDVPFRMSDSHSNAFLDAGLQVLKGGPALAFSRNRHIYGGDFTRSYHQGVVMVAALTGTQELGFAALPRLLAVLSANTWTDLSAAELMQLAAIAYELDPGQIGNVVLPGTVGSANGASVVRLGSGIRPIFEDLADGVITRP